VAEAEEVAECQPPEEADITVEISIERPDPSEEVQVSNAHPRDRHPKGVRDPSPQGHPNHSVHPATDLPNLKNR